MNVPCMLLLHLRQSCEIWRQLLHLLSPRSFPIDRFGTKPGYCGGTARRKGSPPLIVRSSAQIFGDNPGGNSDFKCLVVKPLMPGSFDLLPVALSVPLVLVSQ